MTLTYLVVADVHFGNLGVWPGEVVAGLNNRCRQTGAVLSRVRAAAGVPKREAALIVAGDLFDTSKPTPQVVRAVGEILRDNFVEAHLIMGNHDQHSDEARDNALAVLELVPTVRVYEEPTTFGQFLFLPYGYDFRDVTAVDPGVKVAVAHHGIRDDSMAAWTRDKGAPVDDVAAWLQATGMSHYLAGDWHPRRSWWNGRIQQIGALSPKDWSNPGTDAYGTVLAVSPHHEVMPGTMVLGPAVRRHVVPGPRFVVSKDPADEFTSPHADWWYIRTTYPAHVRAFPTNSTVEPALEAKSVEKAVRAVADHLGDTAELDEYVYDYVDRDSAVPAQLKEQVAQACCKLLQR